MAPVESPYDISGGAALDDDNVPLGCLPIALLYENSMDIQLLRFSIHHMMFEMGRLSTPTACQFPPPYSATISEVYIFQPMALLESPYDIRSGAALDADNVPLGCLPIALLYENSMDI